MMMALLKAFVLEVNIYILSWYHIIIYFWLQTS